jgi:hypothetical protein
MLRTRNGLGILAFSPLVNFLQANNSFVRYNQYVSLIQPSKEDVFFYACPIPIAVESYLKLMYEE